MFRCFPERSFFFAPFPNGIPGPWNEDVIFLLRKMGDFPLQNVSLQEFLRVDEASICHFFASLWIFCLLRTDVGTYEIC